MELKWNDKKFMETGQSVPVTVIKVEKLILDVISKEKNYSAVKVGFLKSKIQN